MEKMEYLELILGQIGLEKRVKLLGKSVKSVRTSQIWVSISVLWMLYLLVEHEKRLTKLEEIRVKNLKKEFEKREKAGDFREEFDENLDDFDAEIGSELG